MASVKTHSAYQRVLLAGAIIIPKILFIARHHWPTPLVVKGLDARVRNFVWCGLFVETLPEGAGVQRWMNKSLADLPAGARGLGSPNVELELHTMAAQVVSGWCYEPTGLRDRGAKLLSNDYGGVQAELYLTQRSARPRLGHDLWATGRRALGWIYGTTMGFPTQALIRDAVGALQATADWTRWRGQYERDYSSFHRIGGGEIQRAREAEDGNLCPDWVPLLRITQKGSSILHRDGTQQRHSHLRALGQGRYVSDFAEWRWVKGRTVRFQPRLPFPLTNAQSACFRLLCDTLVANFPAITRVPDSPGLLRTYNIPKTVDMEWRWEDGVLQRYDDGLPATSAEVLTQRELQNLRPVRIKGTVYVPIFECTPEFTRLVRPWRGDQAWKPKRRHIKRALGKQLREHGTAAGAARVARWHSSDADIADALESIPWHQFVRAPGLTTYDSQLWTRLRHHQLHVWGTKDTRGCAKAHCNSAAQATTGHITWDCSHAQHLWWRLATFWGAKECPQADLRHAVFARRPLSTSYDWRGLFPERDSVVTDRLEHWIKFAWALLITCGLRRLWTQSVAAARGEGDDQENADYYTVIHHWTNKLRGALTAVHSDDSDTRSLDARVLRAIYTGLVTHDEPVPRITNGTPGYLLFFDGGSRGNPGPGGSGSVIVRLGDAPEIVWAAAMSYAQSSTTNNLAEYQGLCTGLAAAEHQDWVPLEVIGDSMMIIRQMTTRRHPKAPTLRPLYERARSTADALRVRNWHHHFRSKNKMADKAANQAMDLGASFQVSADSGRPEFDELRAWLRNDVHQWLTLRDATSPPA